MKFNYIWKNNHSTSEIDIISNPLNKEWLSTLEQQVAQPITFNATDFKTNRQVMIALNQIEAIEASGHFTKVYLLDGTELLLNKS
ncbi:hypothetical protein ACIQXI_07125 [Lysinibacillus sp. NPDC097195]|uniref:hypothetical protein n=1 Tax=Lysinibacillus sp. NPDC097195 TaxID=3364141 RepID=UPI0037F7E0CB